MSGLSRLAAVVFGTMMLALSVAITAETILRKFFSYSLGGVDELGGYAVAVAAPLTFLVTAIDQAHIRINVLHASMPRRVRAVLNVVATLSLALLALFLLYFTFRTVQDTLAYQSIAQTPWATPLIVPQSIWLLAMGAFAVGMLAIAASAIRFLVAGNWQVLDRRFGPGTAEDELEAELADLRAREGAAR